MVLDTIISRCILDGPTQADLIAGFIEFLPPAAQAEARKLWETSQTKVCVCAECAVCTVCADGQRAFISTPINKCGICC